MNSNFIFPGQGSQYRGLGKILFNKSDYAKKIINTANEILEYNIKNVCCSDSNRINHTKYTQPAIFIYSIIADYLIKDAGYKPLAFAGHSLGEYTALVSSNCLNFEDAIKIVKIRAESMEEQSNIRPGSMCALLNFSKIKFEKLKKMIDGEIVIANYNSKKQTIISGDTNAINEFILLSRKNNVRCVPINVSGAFHSPLMENVKVKLDKIIKSTKFNDITTPIYQNVKPEKIFKGIEIKKNLIKQVTSPVHWSVSIKSMAENHTNTFIEIGPGNILSKLNKNINSDINSLNFKSLL